MFVALVVLGLTAVPLVQHAWALLHFPYDLDPGEGIDVGAAVVLLSGGRLYGDPAQFPFFALNYPPLYPLVVAPILVAMGPSVVAGRVVSVASALGVGLLIFGAARVSLRGFPLSSTEEHEATAGPLDGKLAGALGALAFLASGYVLHVMPLARTTSLMVFLSVAGLFCLERATGQRAGFRWLAIGLLSLVAAVYTKPVALDAAAAGLGFLIVGRPEGWVRGLGAAVVLGVGVHVLLQVISGGGYADAVFVANAYPFDADQLLSFSRNVLETHGLLLAVGVAGLVLELRRSEPSPWSWYLGAGLVTAATSGRWGAGESYFFPLIIASCVLGARALGQLEPAVLRSTALAALVAYPFLAGPGPWPVSVLLPGRDRGFQAQIADNPGPEDFAAGQRILDFVAAAKGPVLSEAVGFSVVAGQPLVGSPMLMRGLAAHDRYDSSNLVAALRGGRIERVVLLGFWYPQPVLDAIDAYYQRVDQIDMNHDAYVLLQARSPLSLTLPRQGGGDQKSPT